MSDLLCKTCNGAYSDKAVDGTRYFHACPPSIDPLTLKATPIANARDENVVSTKENPSAPIKSAGTGVTVTKP